MLLVHCIVTVEVNTFVFQWCAMMVVFINILFGTSDRRSDTSFGSKVLQSNHVRSLLTKHAGSHICDKSC